jgi:putative tryptophan/tyrosine transport system substrate-binding protein
MRRREFITLLDGAAVAWPVAVRAQQTDRVRRVGIVTALADDAEGQARAKTLRQGLKDLGWTEGHNVRFDFRFAAGDPRRVQLYVAEIVGMKPDVIVTNNTPVVVALKQVTSSVPIVFVAIADPVGQGFVESLARPGGNLTGFATNELTTIGKMLEMLKATATGLARAAVMFNPATAPYVPGYLRSFEGVGSSFGVEVVAASVRDVTEMEQTIAKLGRERGSGLILPNDAFIVVHHKSIIRLAEQHRVPAIYVYGSFVANGGLMSYGADPYDIWQRAASYVDRVLKGTKPADLPVQQPTKYALVINLKTAKALGLIVPPTLLALADEVIE